MAIREETDLVLAGLDSQPARAGGYLVHGVSAAMRSVERTIAEIASTDIPVLLVGESGTGKEVAALEVHRLSRRWNKPFVKCGCAGMTGDALAALLRRNKNHLEEERESAGSLLLDGINHLDLSAQTRLLHLLPDSSGAAAQGCRSVRVISSTTQNLEVEIKAGRFREELYYRINGIYLRLPPLRERMEDLPSLVEFFLKKYISLFERPEPKLSGSTMDLLQRHTWPGNIRELENLARNIVALGDEEFAVRDLSIEHDRKADGLLAASEPTKPNGNCRSASPSLKEAAREASRHAERALILSQLERTHWNRKRAARELQISYKALLYKLKQLGLDSPSRPEEQ